MGFVDPKGRGIILVVDDDEHCRAAIRRSLERERYVVLEARHGAEALAIMREGVASAMRLIILDLVMPVMSGWSLLEVLRDDPTLAALPVLIVSAVPVHGDASGVGAVLPCLRKPFSRDKLLEAVSDAADLTADSCTAPPSAPVSERSRARKVGREPGLASADSDQPDAGAHTRRH